MKTEFAIVDIETTGGNASGSRITEVAIVIHDGTRVIHKWESLVNPERDIPPPIFALTGISNEMVSRAPLFSEIAHIVHNLLKDRIFVAHSVNFDYSFIRHELEQAGYKWTARKLCTVRAARKIRPGLNSYSLGNLCRCLEIPNLNRHRAMGDASATAILFSMLLEWDTDGQITKMLSKSSQDYRLPPNLPHEEFDRLPHKPGVYYFYNRDKKVVYVGKAINIKKRVASHFTGHNINPQRQNFMREIHAISCEICATELMALLLECSEIRKLWPQFNRALKRFEPKFGLFDYEARSGHRYLAVGRLAKFQHCLKTFNNEYDAVNALLKLAAEFEIDLRFCQFGRPSDGDFVNVIITRPLPEPMHHNLQVQNAVNQLLGDRPTFAILDRGRTDQEQSCVYIENGEFYGMGYLSSDAGFTHVRELRDHVTRYPSSQYVMQLATSFAERNPHKIFRHNETIGTE